MSGHFAIGGAIWPGTAKVLEESGELSQVLGKLIASDGQTEHYDGTDLRQRMTDEIGDLYAALTFFVHVNGLDGEAIATRQERKFDLFLRWHAEQA